MFKHISDVRARPSIIITTVVTVNKPILIFPAGMPRSLEYLKKSLNEDVSVIGSSSLAYDPSRDKYPDWVHLPFVTAPEFDSALKAVISNFNISGIYTPNIVVWDHLNTVLKDLAPEISLVNSSPVNEALSAFESAVEQARSSVNKTLPIASTIRPAPQLSMTELASIFRHSNSIPGMCDNEKIQALFAIFRYAVEGDIIEIGSWWGKSAFILARLAHCHGIGKLLCVDPWSNEHLIQGEKMVDTSSAQVDATEALAIFEMNLLPYSFNHINYLRMPSVDGAAHYRKYPSASTATFGTTQYCGHISILHIDGNHSYDAVKADIESWYDLVCAGGWIILDDYIWPYGDGPQRAGDEFLLKNKNKIDAAFVIGSALFIQLSPQS